MLRLFFIALLKVSLLTSETTLASYIPREDNVIIEVIYLPENCPITSDNGDILTTHYTGYLEDGTVFDSSIGGDPFSFTLGAGEVIKGWDLGLINMCVDEKRKLTIPPSLGYGEQGVEGVIPPNSTIIFDVELVDLKKATFKKVITTVK